jgi:hypothetical protein
MPDNLAQVGVCDNLKQKKVPNSATIAREDKKHQFLTNFRRPKTGRCPFKHRHWGTQNPQVKRIILIINI